MIGIAMHRCGLPIAFGAAITTGLLLLMQALIHVDELSIEEPTPPPGMEWARVIETPEVEVRRELPDEPEIEPPPPVPPIVTGPTEATGPVLVPRIEPPPPTDEISVAANGTPIPIVEPAPQYPQRCAARGIEGWVLVRFDVGTVGAPINAEVVETDGSGCFERAALSAVARFRYRPAMVNDEPVVARGMLKRLTFRLEG